MFAVAILGPDATLRRAALITGVDEATAVVAADAMHAAGILSTLDRVEFTHPGVRSAVYEDVPPARRALLHGAGARQLTDEGVEVERIAAHLLGANPAGEPWATEVLLHAAGTVRELGLPRRALELLDGRWLSRHRRTCARSRSLISAGWSPCSAYPGHTTPRVHAPQYKTLITRLQPVA